MTVSQPKTILLAYGFCLLTLLAFSYESFFAKISGFVFLLMVFLISSSLQFGFFCVKFNPAFFNILYLDLLELVHKCVNKNYSYKHY